MSRADRSYKDLKQKQKSAIAWKMYICIFYFLTIFILTFTAVFAFLD